MLHGVGSASLLECFLGYLTWCSLQSRLPWRCGIQRSFPESSTARNLPDNNKTALVCTNTNNNKTTTREFLIVTPPSKTLNKNQATGRGIKLPSRIEKSCRSTKDEQRWVFKEPGCFPRLTFDTQTCGETRSVCVSTNTTLLMVHHPSCL